MWANLTFRKCSSTRYVQWAEPQPSGFRTNNESPSLFFEALETARQLFPRPNKQLSVLSDFRHRGFYVEILNDWLLLQNGGLLFSSEAV